MLLIVCKGTIFFANKRYKYQNYFYFLVPLLNSASSSDKFNLRIQTAQHGFPVLVGGLFIIDVHHIYFLHLTPFHPFTVKIGDAIGGQGRHLNANFIISNLT